MPSAVAGDAFSIAILDPSELLDVDVDQLTGTSSLVALRWLQTEPAELAHPDPGQDPGHGRQRHIQSRGDLHGGHPQPPQRRDDLNATLVGAVSDHGGRGGPIQQPV